MNLPDRGLSCSPRHNPQEKNQVNRCTNEVRPEYSFTIVELPGADSKQMGESFHFHSDFLSFWGPSSSQTWLTGQFPI